MLGKPVPTPQDQAASKAIRQLESVYGASIHDLLRTPALTRLGGIGFLGTIAYVEGKADTTRLTHSLRTAELALWLADRLTLSELERDILVLYYLFHDVGHLPHSHVTEPLLRSFGSRYTFHDSAGRSIVKNMESLQGWCEAHLCDGRDVWLGLRKVFSGNTADSPDLARVVEIKQCAFNIDRVEGIERTTQALGIPCPRATEVLKGVIRNGDLLEYSDNAIPVAVQFWRVQTQVYNDHVFGIFNQAAEAMLKKAVSLAAGTKVISDIFLSLTDEKAEEEVCRHPRAQEILKLLENGYYLSPLWLAQGDFVRKTQTIQIGRLLCNDLMKIDRLEKEACFFAGLPPSESHLFALHCTRWRSFDVDLSETFQKQLFNLHLSGLRTRFFTRKSPTMVPVAIFGPPVRRRNRLVSKQDELVRADTRDAIELLIQQCSFSD